MRRFDDIDLSRLPAPNAVEPLDYEAILAALLAGFVASWDALRARDPTLPPYTAINLESDPVAIALQVCAYRELLLRARVNDAWRASRLAYATGPDLVNIAAEMGVAPKLLDVGDPDAVPPIPASYEADGDVRLRAQLAWEALSTAGPLGAYQFHALTAHAEVGDVAVFGPESGLVDPGQVKVVILPIPAAETSDEDLAAAVGAYLADENRRPLTDQVIVEVAELETYQVEATIYVGPGADSGLVLAAAEDAVSAYVASRRRINMPVRRSALLAALHVGDDGGASPVDDATLATPASDIEPDEDTAAECSDITITVEAAT